MVKGNITKSAGKYTVTIFKDGEKVFTQSRITDLSDAREILREEKNKLDLSLDKNYDELVGKYVVYSDGDSTCPGKIIGVDYWIGFTIVDANDNKRNLLCVRGPMSPQLKSRYERDESLIKEYNKIFSAYINDMLNNGTVDVNTGSSNSGRMSPNSCAFAA